MCVAKMKTFEFYQFLRDYIANGVFHSTLSSRERSEMRRASSNFVIKGMFIRLLFFCIDSQTDSTWLVPSWEFFKLLILLQQE